MSLTLWSSLARLCQVAQAHGHGSLGLSVCLSISHPMSVWCPHSLPPNMCYIYIILYVQDPRLWPMSPVKLGQPTSTGPSILDMEFTDDEDEEYEPSKDIEVIHLFFVSQAVFVFVCVCVGGGGGCGGGYFLGIVSGVVFKVCLQHIGLYNKSCMSACQPVWLAWQKVRCST